MRTVVGSSSKEVRVEKMPLITDVAAATPDALHRRNLIKFTLPSLTDDCGFGARIVSIEEQFFLHVLLANDTPTAGTNSWLLVFSQANASIADLSST